MKAIVVKQAGGPEQLQIQDVSKPELKVGRNISKSKGFCN